MNYKELYVAYQIGFCMSETNTVNKPLKNHFNTNYI